MGRSAVVRPGVVCPSEGMPDQKFSRSPDQGNPDQDFSRKPDQTMAADDERPDEVRPDTGNGYSGGLIGVFLFCRCLPIPQAGVWAPDFDRTLFSALPIWACPNFESKASPPPRVGPSRFGPVQISQKTCSPASHLRYGKGTDRKLESET